MDTLQATTRFAFFSRQENRAITHTGHATGAATRWREATIAIALLVVLTPFSRAYPQGAYYLGPRLPASGEVVIQRYSGPRAEDEQYCTFSHVNGGPAQRFYLRPDGWLREGEVLRTADTWLLPGEHALAISWVGFRGAIILRFRASAGDTLVSRCFMRISGRELRAVAELTDQRTRKCVASSVRESPCGNPNAPSITDVAIFLPDTSGQLVVFPEDSAVRPLMYHPDRRHPLYVRSQISERTLARFARDPQALQLVKAFANALDVAITDSAGRPLPGQGIRLAGVRNFAHRRRSVNDVGPDLTAFVDDGGVLVTGRGKLYAVSDDSILVDLALAAREQGQALRGLAEEIRLAIRSASAARLDATNLYFPTLGARLVAVLQVARGRERAVLEVGRRDR